MPSPVDLFILILTIALPLAWYFRDSLPLIGSRSPTSGSSVANKARNAVDEGDPRDFVGKMERGVSCVPYTLSHMCNG